MGPVRQRLGGRVEVLEREEERGASTLQLSGLGRRAYWATAIAGKRGKERMGRWEREQADRAAGLHWRKGAAGPRENRPAGLEIEKERGSKRNSFLIS